MRKIWLTRHGESMYNTLHRLGGDSPLSPRGEVYSKKLPDVLVDRVPLARAFTVPCPTCVLWKHVALSEDAVSMWSSPPGARRCADVVRDPHCTARMGLSHSRFGVRYRSG